MADPVDRDVTTYGQLPATGTYLELNVDDRLMEHLDRTMELMRELVRMPVVAEDAAAVTVKVDRPTWIAIRKWAGLPARVAAPPAQRSAAAPE